MENNSFYNLILQDLTDEITPEGKKLLDNWLLESPNNRETYNQISRLLDKIKPSPDLEFPDINSEWEKLAKNLNLPINPAATLTNINSDMENQAGTPHPAGTKLFKYAAAASILIASLVLYYWFMASPQERSNFVSTKNGEIKELTLPDGSIIKLNSASSLEFPNSFPENERRITLEGEAFFQVLKEDRRFIVETKNNNVTVLGTKFNIRERDDKTRVTVKEGKVLFSLGNDSLSNSVILESNQMAVSTNNRIEGPFHIDDAGKALGWLQNRIIFDKTSLGEAIEELKRIYDVNIDLENARLNSFSITGSFEKKQVEVILEAICLTLELNYKVVEGKYLIY